MLARIEQAVSSAGFVGGDDRAALLREIERRGLEIKADLDAKSGPFAAEFVPDVTPLWHLVETFPGDERKAQAFLARRRFGVFLPVFSRATLKELIVAGFDPHPLIFPRHLFVLVWDVLRHWRRIVNCPGVARILCDEHERPIVVSHDTILSVRQLAVAYGGDREPQWRGSPADPPADSASEPERHAPRKKPTRRRKSRRIKNRKRYKAKAVVDSALMAVDGEQRNRALRRSLGLSL